MNWSQCVLPAQMTPACFWVLVELTSHLLKVSFLCNLAVICHYSLLSKLRKPAGNSGKVNYACYLKWGQKLLYWTFPTAHPYPLKSLFEWKINNVRFRSYVFLQRILNRRYRVCEAGQKVGKSKLHNPKVQLCHLSLFLLGDSFGADHFVNKTGHAKI